MAQTLKPGSTATEDVFAVYTDATLDRSRMTIKSKMGAGDRGSAIVLKGDTITAGMVAEHDRVTKGAAAATSRTSRRAPARNVAEPGSTAEGTPNGDDGNGDGGTGGTDTK